MTPKNRKAYLVWHNGILMNQYFHIQSAYDHVEHFYKHLLVCPMVSFCQLTRRFTKVSQSIFPLKNGDSVRIQVVIITKTFKAPLVGVPQ